MERYNQKTREDFLHIDLINNRPFRFDEIYMQLELINKGNEGIGGFKENKNAYNAGELIGINAKRITVLGNPGMGKTTMLKYLAGLCSEKGDISPVYIKLTDYSKAYVKENITLKEYLYKEIKAYNVQESAIDKALMNGKIILLLDGLDEVKRELHRDMLRKAKDFSSSNRQCQVILTSRKYNFSNKEFKDAETPFTEIMFEIKELSETEIRKYILNYYSKIIAPQYQVRVASKVTRKIFYGNRGIRKMAENPFLLSILCMIGKDNEIPEFRRELYKKCTELLIGKRNDNENECKLAIGKILKEIAYDSFGNNYKCFEIEYAVNIIRNATKHEKCCDSCDKVKCLERLCTDNSILIKSDSGGYEFLHRTFCEYYASLKMYELGFSTVVEKIKDPMWEEPVKLYAGQIKKQQEGKYFIEKVWEVNKELALRCCPEMNSIVGIDMVGNLLGKMSIDERIKFIDGLSYAGTDDLNNASAVVDTLKVIVEPQKDLELIGHVVLKLESIKEDVKDEEIKKEITDIIESKIGDKETRKRRFDKYLADIMVPIKGGKFAMGSPESETDRCLSWDSNAKKWITVEDEQQHDVKVSSFLATKHPITLGIFGNVLDETGYTMRNEKGRGSYLWNEKKNQWVFTEGINWQCNVNGNMRNDEEMRKYDDHPVIHVNWYEAYIFGRLFDCSLPTEAEWEYACRAETQTPFSTGDYLTADQANYDGNYPYNGGQKGRYIADTTPVGSYRCNDFGLYDMHGNVNEWCMDWYDQDYYQKCLEFNKEVEKPKGATEGMFRVLRGGSWYSNARNCRSARRSHDIPGYRDSYVGFRLISHRTEEGI